MFRVNLPTTSNHTICVRVVFRFELRKAILPHGVIESLWSGQMGKQYAWPVHLDVFGHTWMMSRKKWLQRRFHSAWNVDGIMLSFSNLLNPFLLTSFIIWFKHCKRNFVYTKPCRTKHWKAKVLSRALSFKYLAPASPLCFFLLRDAPSICVYFIHSYH